MQIDLIDPTDLVFESFEGVMVTGDIKNCIILRQGDQTIRFPVCLIREVALAMSQVEQGER